MKKAIVIETGGDEIAYSDLELPKEGDLMTNSQAMAVDRANKPSPRSIRAREQRIWVSKQQITQGEERGSYQSACGESQNMSLDRPDASSIKNGSAFRTRKMNLMAI